MGEIFAWAMQHNLNLIVQFHNELLRLMQNEIVAVNKKIEANDDQNRKKALAHRKHFYTLVYEKKLRINTFLMMYSGLEEFLYHVPKALGKEVTIEGSGSIKRFKAVFKKVFGMDLSQDPDWRFICDCEKIRDCLLHANGRLDLLKKRDDLDSIIARSSGFLQVRTDHVELTGEFVGKMQDVLNSFIAKVESKGTA